MAKISIVMAVFNGARDLERTMSSLFVQTEGDFELIVVDDGSTDDTAAILRQCKDPRLRIVTQEHAGLTRALILGCSQALAPIIARQDCGDHSHPTRLARQLRVLDEEPNAVLVSCHTRYHGPENETLYVSSQDGAEVRASLLHGSAGVLRGLSHHGSAMFRRSAYLQAGGYRQEFHVAQDLDLWMRLAPLGAFEIVPSVLYDAIVTTGAISARRRSEQLRSAAIAFELRDASDPQALLRKLAEIPSKAAPNTRRNEADSLYFIASCLKRRRDRRWVRYARRALKRNPLFFRAWLLFLRASSTR